MTDPNISKIPINPRSIDELFLEAKTHITNLNNGLSPLFRELDSKEVEELKSYLVNFQLKLEEYRQNYKNKKDKLSSKNAYRY